MPADERAVLVELVDDLLTSGSASAIDDLLAIGNTNERVNLCLSHRFLGDESERLEGHDQG